MKSEVIQFFCVFMNNGFIEKVERIKVKEKKERKRKRKRRRETRK